MAWSVFYKSWIILLNSTSSGNARKILKTSSLSSTKSFMNLVLLLYVCLHFFIILGSESTLCIIFGIDCPRLQTSSLLILLNGNFSWSYSMALLKTPVCRVAFPSHTQYIESSSSLEMLFVGVCNQLSTNRPITLPCLTSS